MKLSARTKMRNIILNLSIAIMVYGVILAVWGFIALPPG